MNVQYNRPTYTPTNFGAMKKSQFSGIDFAVIEKFKAPIERFNSHKDLQEWASQEFFKASTKNYGGRKKLTVYQRISAVNDWSSTLNKSSYSETEKFLALNGVVRGLKPNEDKSCISLNREILDKTMNEVRETLKQNPKRQFDFGKMYSENLHDMYTKAMHIDENTTGWIIIPSKENDPVNYYENVKVLQNLSDKHWCTKHGGADLYLRDGDFHIYMEKGVPKLAIRFNEDTIREVNNDMNDRKISSEYMDILEEYIKKNDFILSEKAELDIHNAKKLNNRLEHIEERKSEVPQTPKKSIWGILLGLFDKN